MPTGDRLVALVKMLSYKEYEDIYSTVGTYGGKETKLGLILRSYHQHEFSDTKEIHEALDLKGSSAAVNQLRYRLRSVLKSYLSSKSYKYVTKSDSFNARVDLLKTVLEADILYVKGEESQSVKITEKAYKETGIGLNTPEELMCLDRIIRYAGAGKRVEDLVELLDAQTILLNELLASSKSYKVYYECMQPIFQKRKTFHDAQREIEDAIHALEELDRGSDSTTCRYYLLRMNVYYKVNIGDYEAAMIDATKFLHLINNSKKHNTQSNVFGATVQIGNISAYANDPDTAISYFNSALQLAPSKSSNYLRVSAALLSCRILQGENQIARNLVQVNESLVRTLGDTSISQEWVYRKAYVEHLLGSHTSALKLLSTSLKFSSKDNNWSVSCRILEFQCLYKSKEYDVFEYRYLSLKKSPEFRRLKSKRQRVIVSLLQFLRSPLQKEMKVIEDLLKRLGESNPDMLWDPYGLEILRFEVWWSKSVV